MKEDVEGFVTKKEAAALLNIGLFCLDKWVKKGLLTPHFVRNYQQLYFDRSEVLQLALAHADESMDVWQVKALALQALGIARNTEKRVVELYGHFGLDIEPLERDEGSVQALAQEIALEPTEQQVRDRAWVRFWGSAFFSIDTAYLDLAGLLLSDDEPWLRYISFGERVTKTVCVTSSELLAVSPELRAAYKYFHAGKASLTHTSYLYCHRRYGEGTARGVFESRRNVVEELSLLII